MSETVVQEVKRSGGWMIFLGILMMLAGLAAMLAPLASGVVVVWIIGGVVLFVGAVALINAFSAESFWPGAGDFLMGLLYTAVGVLLWMRPIAGLTALGTIVAIFLLLRGITQIAVSFQLKPAKGWGWVLFGGILATLFGILLFANWPMAGMWAIGVFLGIELLFSGWTIVFVGGDLRDAAKVMKRMSPGTGGDAATP